LNASFTLYDHDITPPFQPTAITDSSGNWIGVHFREPLNSGPWYEGNWTETCVITGTITLRQPALKIVSSTGWARTDSNSLTVLLQTQSLITNVGLDLNAYVKARFGSQYYVVLQTHNAYGWVMTDGRHTSGLDMFDAALWTAQQTAKRQGLTVKNWGVDYSNFSDPYSWQAKFILSA
jgi:hypothetical protein